MLNGLYWQRSSGQVRGLGTKFSSLKFQESWVGHHSLCAVMLRGDKYTFSGLVIRCVSKLVNPEKVAFEDKVVCHNYDPFDGDCADEFLCRTWFFSPVAAQGLRRVKEYARLGLLSATLQLEIDHMMAFSHRWLPAAWESLNDALPKCREFRGKVDSNLIRWGWCFQASSWISLTPTVTWNI